jgi:hypothetical protein
MEFGLLKSKIEKKLTESYSKNTFNKEIKNFKKVVLENSNISKAYHIYNELGKNKSFQKEFAEDYLNECVDLYNRINFSKTSIKMLESWLKDVVCKNEYKDIDTVFTKNTMVIENIIESKNTLIGNLTKPIEKTETVNIPLNKIVEVANKTLKNYLESLNESDLTDVKKYMSLSENDLSKRYEVLSEMVIDKLEKMSSSSDVEVKTSINETISKIKTDKITSISVLQLKNLNESL